MKKLLVLLFISFIARAESYAGSLQDRQGTSTWNVNEYGQGAVYSNRGIETFQVQPSYQQPTWNNPTPGQYQAPLNNYFVPFPGVGNEQY